MGVYNFTMFAGELTVPAWQLNPTVTAEGPAVTTAVIPEGAEVLGATLTVNMSIPSGYRNDADLDVDFNGTNVVKDLPGDKDRVVKCNVTRLYSHGYNSVHLDWTRNAWASGMWEQTCRVRVDLEVQTAPEPLDVARAGQSFLNDLQSLLTGQMDAGEFAQKYQWPLLGCGAAALAAALLLWGRGR